MQNAKDTFYVTLRDRLAAVNPTRTMVVREVIRSGVLVAENELGSAMEPVNAFCLHWAEMSANAAGEMPLVALRCEIQYATDGSAASGGMDRGRLMAAMDAELIAAVNAAPQNTMKMNYVGAAGGSGVAAVAMGTNVFWGDVSFGPLTTKDERLERMATVEVFAYQEAGEL